MEAAIERAEQQATESAQRARHARDVYLTLTSDGSEPYTPLSTAEATAQSGLEMGVTYPRMASTVSPLPTPEALSRASRHATSGGPVGGGLMSFQHHQQGGRMPPGCVRGASTPQHPNGAPVPPTSPQTHPSVSSRQLSQPSPVTTSRQVSCAPTPTLRKGLSTFKSEARLAPFRLRLRDPPLPDDEDAAMRRGFFRKCETYKLRKEYLKQSRWSNQFTGNPEVEDRFHRYVTEYQLERVQKRLWITAVILAFNGALSQLQGLPLVWAIPHMLLPTAVLVIAALLLAPWAPRDEAWDTADAKACLPPSLDGGRAPSRQSRDHGPFTAGYLRGPGPGATAGPSGGPRWPCGTTPSVGSLGDAAPATGTQRQSLPRQWWRLVVLIASVVCYNMILWSDFFRQRSAGSYQHHPALELAWQLVWLLLAASATVFNAALDFAHCVLASILLYLSFAGACAAEMADLGRITDHLHHPDDVAMYRKRVLGEIIKALLSGAVGLFLFIMGAHRINRFERHSFVQQYLLWGKVGENEELLAGHHVELLALFANPTLPTHIAQQLGLKPLRLGQELRFLLRTIPKLYLEVQPAATMADARQALERYNPRIIMFSGHTFMGALAFELDNGRIDTHSPPAHFVNLLRLATARSAALRKRLELVFLNGCETTSLANDIVSAMPWLKVICWHTITEDQAARSFAVGFVDAVGESLVVNDLRHRGRVTVEEAFMAGCVHMQSEGFRLGDPRDYLHPPGHPHTHKPDYSGSCFGCLPPVHGDAVLLVRQGGSNVILRCTPRGKLVGERIPPSPQYVSEDSSLGGANGRMVEEPWRRHQAGAGTGAETVQEEDQEVDDEDQSPGRVRHV